MKKYFAYGALVVVIIVGIILLQQNPGTTNTNAAENAEFAQCLTDADAVFYGAYWCPHCQDQKEMFGDAENDLPYVECALPGNPNAMTQQCKDAGIEGYPTWIFADGSRLSGTQSFATLADKTGCRVPGQTTNTNTVDEGEQSQINESTNTNTAVQDSE